MKLDHTNTVQLRAVFEALLAGEGHFNYSAAKAMAEEFCAAEEQRQREQSAKQMQADMGNAIEDLMRDGCTYQEAAAALNID